MADFEGKTVLLCISGGIAAYKSVELARLLVKRNADVKVVMSAAGERFVTPLTFRSITGNPVATSMWTDPSSPFPHISLCDEADLIVVAPATANIIAKYARGVADDLLSTTLIAARGSVILAPAMNSRMYLHPATQENLQILRERGVIVIDPGTGGLACLEEGVGRMAEPAEILSVLEREIGRAGDLVGVRVTVTAGPTREYMDPARFLSNPSTGRMGFSIADRAARRGADVTLIAGPTDLPPPAGVRVVGVVSAGDMRRAVLDNVGETDVLIMAAAVADYRPAEVAPRKFKKRDGIPEVRLVSTEDILSEIKELKEKPLIVGFAAETDEVIENAKKKLVDKAMDLIVANKVGEPDSGFAAATDLAAIISADSENAELAMVSKLDLADLLLDRIADALGE
jgi:phosphopantothenoylcysteine decarboxylase/phosphopantothenate--cysteine ligase